MSARTLSDIGSEWITVAHRVQVDRDRDGWDWLLRNDDTAALQAALATGASRYLMAQRRNESGTIELVAKLRK